MRWYAKKSAGNGQGLVINEEDGRNVAVAYDEKDAQLLAAAPELASALLYAAKCLKRNRTCVCKKCNGRLDEVFAALHKAGVTAQ